MKKHKIMSNVSKKNPVSAKYDYHNLNQEILNNQCQRIVYQSVYRTFLVLLRDNLCDLSGKYFHHLTTKGH